MLKFSRTARAPFIHSLHALHLHKPRFSLIFRTFRSFSSIPPSNPKSFISTQSLRLKLFFTGTNRPFKSDDILAFASLFFLSHSLFLLAATTTFVSIIVLVVNSLQFQEYFAAALSDLLMNQTGFRITFQSAIVPRWLENTIRLENVSIVCNDKTWTDYKNTTDPTSIDQTIDTNWTYWDLQANSIDVTLSLWGWMDGKGPLKECTVKGVRGVIDRRHIILDPKWKPFRRSPSFGDFDLSKFVLEDMLVTILNPEFRPYHISVFNAELPCLRKQWLLYDILSADSIVGVFDNCLFSVHKPQRADLVVNEKTKGAWAKLSHLQINSIPIDHFKIGATGPFSWIKGAKIDIDLHLLFPQSHASDDMDMMRRIRSEIDDLKNTAMSKLETIVSQHPERDAILDMKKRKEGTRHYKAQHPRDDETQVNSFPPIPQGPPSIGMFWNVKLNDLKASVPLIPSELSYMNSALIRPVVAYMNANKTCIDLSFDAKMDVDNFDGSWDIYAAGIVDVLSEEVGRALTLMTQNERERNKRLRQIGLWSIQSVGRQIIQLLEYAQEMGKNSFDSWTSDQTATYLKNPIW